MLAFLDGKKTYLAAVLVAILNLLVAVHVIKFQLDTLGAADSILALFIGAMRLFARKPGPLAPPAKMPLVGEIKE